MVIRLLLLEGIAHFIGDYYLQSNTIAMCKAKSYYYTFLHSLMYAIPHYLIWMMVCFGNAVVFLYVTFLVVAHSLVDMGKVRLTMREEILKQKGYMVLASEKWRYVLDQLMHYVLMLLVTFFMYDKLVKSGVSVTFANEAQLFFMLLVVVLYQPWFVSACILWCEECAITNAYALQQADFKTITLLFGVSLYRECYLTSILLVLLWWLFGKGSKKDIMWTMVSIIVLIFSWKMMIISYF